MRCFRNDRRFWAAFASAMITLLATSANAQFAPAPGTGTVALPCLQVTPDLGRLVANLHLGQCAVVCKGCGCKGGPGFRTPAKADGGNGGCVSFADVNRLCGPPPHARCVAECAPVQPACFLQGRANVAALAKAQGVALNWLAPPSGNAAASAEAAAGANALTPSPATALSQADKPDELISPALLEARKSAAGNWAASSYRCGEKRTCGEMTSCDEALFHHQRCGLKRLDGTGNGVPCKALCR